MKLIKVISYIIGLSGLIEMGTGIILFINDIPGTLIVFGFIQVMISFFVSDI